MQATDVPLHDWANQKEVAALLGVSQKTASAWAKAGKLRAFEHGFACCGRRIYSRTLLSRAGRSYLGDQEKGGPA